MKSDKTSVTEVKDIKLEFFIEDFTAYFEENKIPYPRKYRKGMFDYKPTQVPKLIPLDKMITGQSTGLVLNMSDIPTWKQVGEKLKTIYGTDDISSYHLGYIQWQDKPLFPVSNPAFIARYDANGNLKAEHNSWTFTESKKIVLENLWFLGKKEN